MGQAAAVDGVAAAANEGGAGPVRTCRSFCLERVKGLSSNAPVTAARYHNVLHGGQQLSDDYEVDSHVIGSGVCGDVVLARGRVDQRRFALKTMRKGQFRGSKRQHLTEEVEIYLTLDHPNIARLHDVYETEDSIYCLTQYCEGGELYSRLQRLGVYPDVEAADATRQMLRAVGYLHFHDIVHRDIKLENFVYETKDSSSQLKLIDFGMAMFWDGSTPMLVQCGSIMYVSPDVLCGEGYTDKCDLWSLGVIAWMLLTGYPPFDGEEEVVIEQIRAGQADWGRKDMWTCVRSEATDFVRCLLETNPKFRPSAQEALSHTWLAPPATSRADAGILSDAVLESLQRYTDASSIRRAMLQFLAHEVAPEETKELREVFLALDRNNRGTLAFTDLQDAIREATAPRQQLEEAPVGAAAAWPQRPAQEEDGITRLFSKLDVNGDEQVYYLDFLAATLESLPCICEGTLQAAFNRLDSDRTGSISLHRAKKALGETFEGVSVEELLAEVDRGGHEGLTFEMFVEILGLGTKASEASEDNSENMPCPEVSKETKRVPVSQETIPESRWIIHETVTGVLGWAAELLAPANGCRTPGTNAVALFGGPAPPPSRSPRVAPVAPASVWLESTAGSTPPQDVHHRFMQAHGLLTEKVPWETGPPPKVRSQRSRILSGMGSAEGGKSLPCN